MKIYTFIFSPIEVNTYILSDDDGNCAVVDCGCYSRPEFERLERLLDERELKPVLLLNTHCHLDHIFGNKMFLDKYGLKTYCHIAEEENRNDAVQHAFIFGLTMDDPPETERFINDGEIIPFGSVRLKAIHVPGHTAGSIAFYEKESNFVFTGDALFKGSIGRTDLPGGDFDTLLNSIRTGLFTLPPDTVVYPGHGEPTTIENEIKTNPFFR